MDSARLYRTILVTASVAVAFGVMLWIQAKFDGADRKNALLLVQEYRSKAGWTLPEVIAKHNPGKMPSWNVSTDSSCMQHERVTAIVDATEYAFMVDINGPSIHPANEEGKMLLAELDEAKPAPASSASAAAAGAP